jgi:nitroreductase
MNQQPWHFVVATIEQRDCHSRFVACLSEANVRWASRAPVLMFSVAKRAFDNEQPNRFAWHDTGLATAGLMIQATALGLHVHCMGGFRRATARQHLGIRDDFDPVAAIAMGYVGSPDSLPDDLRETELVVRSRRPTAQWVFGERWGNPWPCDRLKSRQDLGARSMAHDMKRSKAGSVETHERR